MNQLIIDRLQALRQEMKQRKIDIYLVFSADPHLSEYLPDRFKAREWLSGFTGSVGTLVVTQETAGLWADSRYWVMAEKQLSGTTIQLHKMGIDKSYLEWIEQFFTQNPQASVIAVDGATMSLADYETLNATLEPFKTDLYIEDDLVDQIWQDRPDLPLAPIYSHPAQFCAATCDHKLEQVRHLLKEHRAQWLFLSALDDIAWLTNLRGNDVQYNPVFLSHALIGLEEAILFVDPAKLTDALRNDLAVSGIDVQPYHDVEMTLRTLKGERLMLDPKKVTVKLAKALPATMNIYADINPTTQLKSFKSDFEIEQIKQAMVQDGIALCHFFAWLEEAVAKHETISELTIDQQLTQLRSERAHYISDSFGTIAGFNANGAMPHYSATPTDFSMIDTAGLLLIDSGGQYLNGTTDITRVVAIQEVTEAQKEDYTLVLKAHIALARARFPYNLPGQQLDAICRQPLWQAGLNYGHGTGHGVGYFLNVHEGPQVISYLSPITAYSPLKEGVVLSNEPGLYRPGQWGIRLENLMVTRAWETPSGDAFGRFLCFETLTLCPFDSRCIIHSALTHEERTWLNEYHQHVYSRLSPHLSGDALAWLTRQTQAI